MRNGYSQVEADYSPSTMVDSLDALIDDYRRESAAARATLRYRTYSYGADPDETLDFFPAAPGAPVHVFVHGGYWQDLSKDDSSFPAVQFHRNGTAYIALNYTLAPAATLDRIVDQVRRGVAWVHTHAAELGVDAGRLVLSGSSAGAHLAGMAALTRWSSLGLPEDAVSGLVLLSGIYDLAPLVGTYINDAVGLEPESAARNSPLRLLEQHHPAVPAVVAWGEIETAAFKQQSIRFAEAWRAHGNAVTTVEVAGRNHFDIVHELGVADGPVGSPPPRRKG